MLRISAQPYLHISQNPVIGNDSLRPSLQCFIMACLCFLEIWLYLLVPSSLKSAMTAEWAPTQQKFKRSFLLKEYVLLDPGQAILAD